MATQTEQPIIVKEQTTPTLSFQLQNEDDVDISLEDLTTLKLTLFDVATGGIINDRNNQDVLNANNVEVSSTGLVTWTLQPADSAVVTTTIRAGSEEEHRAVFVWTWDSGAKTGMEEIPLYVRQTTKIPVA